MIIRYSAIGRRSSGSRVSRIAARMTPSVLPMPPRMTMTTISMLLVKSKPVGVMVSLKCP